MGRHGGQLRPAVLALLGVVILRSLTAQSFLTLAAGRLTVRKASPRVPDLVTSSGQILLGQTLRANEAEVQAPEFWGALCRDATALLAPIPELLSPFSPRHQDTSLSGLLCMACALSGSLVTFSYLVPLP